MFYCRCRLSHHHPSYCNSQVTWHCRLGFLFPTHLWYLLESSTLEFLYQVIKSLYWSRDGKALGLPIFHWHAHIFSPFLMDLLWCLGSMSTYLQGSNILSQQKFISNILAHSDLTNTKVFATSLKLMVKHCPDMESNYLIPLPIIRLFEVFLTAPSAGKILLKQYYHIYRIIQNSFVGEFQVPTLPTPHQKKKKGNVMYRDYRSWMWCLSLTQCLTISYKL